MSSIDIDQDNVKSISDKCHQLNELQSQLKEKEEAISKLKHKIRDMEERIIPEMMQEAGVSKIKLKDGTRVGISLKKDGKVFILNGGYKTNIEEMAKMYQKAS